jgi:hypothetical protein
MQIWPFPNILYNNKPSLTHLRLFQGDILYFMCVDWVIVDNSPNFELAFIYWLYILKVFTCKLWGTRKMWGWQKVENVRVAKAKRAIMKAQATIATIQYLGSFIHALLNDLFLTLMWSQMCDQVDNGSKGLVAQL